MKYLWAPWRAEYISAEKKGCIFCRAVNDTQDDKNLLLYRGKECFIILNKYPYNNGHLMIAPNKHKYGLKELTQEELLEIMQLLCKAQQALEQHLKPEGFNIGVNMGKAAGAGEEHLHFHIVPRWVGDTNYMPVLGETKVISHYLSELLLRLKSSF
ncbi:MAG TPA: HIT family protein [Candidatus Hypogeohydataceae bacterium YC41]